MPLPIALIVGAVTAGVTGVGVGVHGAIKMKEANDTMKLAQSRHSRNMERARATNLAACAEMDKLGKLELEILHSFSTFSDVFEQIHNRPQFKEYSKDGIEIPKYDGEKIKEVSVGAGVLLGGLGGAAAGTAGGFAAAGATTAAVMAFGTASTGTAIASLSGAALTNATLAALGGGAIAAGGGGMALGSLVLGGATLGVGLLVGGIIFGATGGKLSEKADEAYRQMKESEADINKICAYLDELSDISKQFYHSLSCINEVYQRHLNGLTTIVTMLEHTDYEHYTPQEKILTENTVLLVGLLYKMCQVNIVKKTGNEINKINAELITESVNNARAVFSEKNLGELPTVTIKEVKETKGKSESAVRSSSGFSLKVFNVQKINSHEYYADVVVNHAPIHVGNYCISAKHEKFKIVEIKDNTALVSAASAAIGKTVRVRLQTNGPGDLAGRTLFQAGKV